MPEEYDRIKREYGDAGPSLLLDLQERITRLEASYENADRQRTEILAMLTEIRQDLRVANLQMMDRDIKEIREKELAEIHKRLDSHERILNEAKGGFNVGITAVRVVWAILGTVLGGIVGFIASHWKH